MYEEEVLLPYSTLTLSTHEITAFLSKSCLSAQIQISLI